ncbi:MAG TPA: class I SAM-dependent methyltransferase, partial [Polynucleobacter sp.]|nr:class I SAM-dependent methyltransferase [Polynucleobacter sp.]
MTSFSTDWLSLREAADHRSRNPFLQNQVLQYLEEIGSLKNDPIDIIDLGSGTGSNLRALAPLIQHSQTWTLVDYDPLLLIAAREKLCTWADRYIDGDNHHYMDDVMRPVTLVKNHLEINVTFLQKDLSSDLSLILSKSADLITAAAFFDLVASDWIEQFCKALQAPLYTVLTYNGVEKWFPTDPSDAEILKAFHSHQARDKGFGPAAGPLALNKLKHLLKQRGFQVDTGSSPWMLGQSDSSLIARLALGTAKAAAETKLVPIATTEQWSVLRSQSQRCEIGHDDLFAI